MDEAAEHVVTIDVMKRRGSGGDRAGGNFEIDATMWALSVVVADVLPKDTLKVAATENKHPVGIRFAPSSPSVPRRHWLEAIESVS